MRCSSYFIGNALSLNKVIKFCKRHKYTHQLFNDVVHVKLPDCIDIYYFKNGTMVTWNLNKKISRVFAEEAKEFADEENKIFIEEHFIYYYGDKTMMKSHAYFNAEIITLAEDDDEIRLAVSYGLAHSVKMSFYQRLLFDMTDKYSYIVRQLAETGRINLRRKEIAQIIGAIFWVKSSVNLRSEYLHIPHYFWQHTSLESTYLMVERYMDLSKRLSMLNQKLDILNEIFNLLSNELQHQHSTKLEWVIIILITVEIIFNIIPLIH